MAENTNQFVDKQVGDSLVRIPPSVVKVHERVKEDNGSGGIRTHEPPPCQGSLVPPPTSTSSAFVEEDGARGFESLSTAGTGISINWQQFHQYLLQRMNAKTAEDRLRYAKQFASVLANEKDVSSLQQLSPNKRIHVQKALSCLARYTGKTELWTQIRRTHGLTWSTGTEQLDAFTRFFSNDNSLEKMIESLKQARRVLPKTYGDILLFCTLTGLRNSECIECIKLIRNPEQFKIYYNESNQCLEHFRFKELFLRKTKSAYLTICDRQMLMELVQNLETATPTLNALKMAIRHRCPYMQMKWCRKIHASFLYQNNIPQIIIDLLQGRVPRSVLAQHYLLPKPSFKEDVLQALEGLRREIDEDKQR